MARIVFAGTAGGTTAQLDANFSELYGLLDGTGAGSSASLEITGVDNTTTYGARSNSLVFENNTSTVGGGNDIVWQVGDSLATQKWAAISSHIIGNSGTEAAGALVFSTGNSAGLIERLRLTDAGDAVFSPQTSPPSLAANGTMVMNLTSNTNLRISVRGSDGVTRVANITLA